MKKLLLPFFVFSVLLIVGAFLYTGSFKTEEIKTDHYEDKITVGVALWPGHLPLVVADRLGYFKDAGLNVELKRYDALAEVSNDYVSGKLQARANLTLDTISEHLGGLDHKVVLVIDYSNGADAIIASANVATLKDIRGKKVAYEHGTLEEYFLTWALKEEHLSIADIESVPANPEQAVTLLQEGKVDVAVSYEPFISKLTAADGFHPIYSSKEAPGLISDVLTFRSDFLESHPEAVEMFTAAYFRALEYWNEHPKDAAALMAQEFKATTTEDIMRQLGLITMLDKGDNQTSLTFAAGPQSLYGQLRSVGSFLKQQRGLSGHLDTDKLIERRFIKNVIRKD
jgi:NitT/TauT family transport system substrate-binding protein